MCPLLLRAASQYAQHVTGDHYFTAEPGSAAHRRTLDLELAGRRVQVSTGSGTFSPTRLDQGTAVLLDRVPAPPATGDVLDLGCGWGPIALALALSSPGATVWAVDVNERALDLTRDNAAALGLANVRAVTPDQVPDDVVFAAIWSNPPIRVGKDRLHEMLLHWLPRLAAGASAWLVVQRNLGSDSLARWLAEQLEDGFDVSRAGSSKGYRVLEVRRGEGAA